MGNKLNIICNAASKKFGTVCGVQSLAGGDYALVILRASAPFADRPYMTIRGDVGNAGDAHFFFGHYDMDKETALSDFNKRIAGLAA